MAFEEFGQIEECTLIQKYQHREIQVSAVIHFASIGQDVHAASVMDGVTADGISLQVAIIPKLVGKLRRQAGASPGRRKRFPTAWRLSRPSKVLHDGLEAPTARRKASPTSWSFSRPSKTLPDRLEALQAVKAIPEGLEALQAVENDS
ncbi:hypothetical protein PSHT_12495 [Puccinia striiformis]|uniref:Uncharacterized protein n=1 Tax=Puccinia striiformis TaxID=27350 RepID=A0A2S4UW70_9BASI|nr:hypothetical protein PSHT_12495 [Puccinia striiformis]